MTAEQLIQGLRQIQSGVIPVDCIIDMAPEIEQYLKTCALREQSVLHKDSAKTLEIIDRILYDLKIA